MMDTLTGFLLAAVTILFYLQVVHRRRYLIRDAIKALPTPTTPKEAFDILNLNYNHEFPFISEKALQLGFLKTYATPSIAKILLSTKKLTHETGKRVDDTDLLIRESTERLFGTDRFEAAIKNINAQHSKYKIKNDDFLYVLCVFMIDPISWQEEYGYRKLVKNEYTAYYIFWREYGVRMNITDIPDSFEACRKYMEEFEEKNMVFHKSNQMLSESTNSFFLGLYIPTSLILYTKPVVSCFLYPRLRAAVGVSEPPFILERSIKVGMRLVALSVRYLLFPRSVAVKRTPDVKLANGNYCPVFNPYGDFYPNGYRIEELGH